MSHDAWRHGQDAGQPRCEWYTHGSRARAAARGWHERSDGHDGAASEWHDEAPWPNWHRSERGTRYGTAQRDSPRRDEEGWQRAHTPLLFAGRGRKLGEATTVGEETPSVTQSATSRAHLVVAPAGLRDFAAARQMSPFRAPMEGIHETNKEACRQCVEAGRHTFGFNAWLTETQLHTLDAVSYPGPEVGQKDPLRSFAQQLCSGNIPLGYAGEHKFLYDHFRREAERADWRLKWHKGGGAYDCICLGCTGCSALLRIETPYFGKNGQTRRSDIIEIQDRLLQFLFARPGELPPSVQESLKKSSCIVEAMNPGRFVLGVEVTTAGG